MARLTNIYNIKDVRQRQAAKDGYCRPTVAELFLSSRDYAFGWCSRQPILTVLGEFIYDNNDEIIVMES